MSEVVAVEEVRSRTEQRESPLYAGRVEVYARSVSGRFRTVKWAALVGLLAIYYLAPWIRWDRGPGLPSQAILADFSTRRIYFFWIELWPQEIYFLTGVLIMAAFGLFLATALFGRLWCGYACPQTVWTDLFMMVERWLEGDRNQRMRFDKAPWTTDKILRRTSKHAIWILIALFTGGAWIMYFNDAPDLVHDLVTGQAGLAVYFFVGLFTATTYLLAGMAREQVCTYMCPWPRIQGALVDKDTLAVTYEEWRGEPRGKHKSGDSWEGRGDCIDCRQCVAVCPTGIDIRAGFQLECIGCGLCIDACNTVMDKVGRPRNLISYDSEQNQVLRAAGEPSRYRLVRPRTILYAGVLVLVACVMLGLLALRQTTDVNILPERNPLFVRLADGSIRNGYTIKIMNKEHEPRVYRLTVAGEPGALLTSIDETRPEPSLELEAPADDVASHRVYLKLPAAAVTDDTMPLTLDLTDTATGKVQQFRTVFRGPEG